MMIISKSIVENNNNSEYREWVPVGRFVKMIIFLFYIFSISIVIIVLVLEPQVMMFLLMIFGGVCILILLTYWNYRGLLITITKNQIEVKYGIFNHKIIPLIKIMSCEIIKATFRKYGGVGIRLGFDGSVAYSTGFGDAVKLICQHSKPFVFSTNNPQKICNLISKHLKS